MSVLAETGEIRQELKEPYERLSMVVTAGKHLRRTDGTSSKLDKSGHNVDVLKFHELHNFLLLFLLFVSFFACGETGFRVRQGLSAILRGSYDPTRGPGRKIGHGHKKCGEPGGKWEARGRAGQQKEDA